MICVPFTIVETCRLQSFCITHQVLLSSYHKYYYSNKTYHGKIDLLLVSDKESIIIDYKLKNTKDKAYIDQLNGYREVISNKLNLPTSCYLYSIIDEVFEKI